VNRSLVLLNLLRGRAWLRRWTRSFRTLKGLLLALVGSLVFVPMIVAALLAPRVQTTAQLGAIREYGPLALFTYCVLNVLLSSGDRAVYYSPAEVIFLFSGPFRPRQILLYKITAGLAASFLTALVATIAFGPHAASYHAAFLGLFLSFHLLYLFSLSVGLAISTFGALAFNWSRRLLLLAIGLIALGALWPLGERAMSMAPMELLQQVLHSPTVAAIVAPFRPFVWTFSSDRAWPDLIEWSALSLIIDLTLLGVVLALNGQFLEASAAASARIYSRLQRARRGESLVASNHARATLPMLPWWGGIGPNFWRQLTPVSRSPARLAGLFLLYLVPVGMLLVMARNMPGGESVLAPMLPMLLGMTVVTSSAVNYDFRGDLHRMEDLKTLPIAPYRLVLGQLLTPVLVLSLGQWLTLALIALTTSPDRTLVLSAAVLIAPANLLLAAVENLYFLWYPYRATGINSFDFQAIGRQSLLSLAKVATVGMAAGIAAGLGALVFWLTGGSWASTIATAWVVASACGLGLIPLVALAFQDFDVSAEGTE
jgi:hypothetical protein